MARFLTASPRFRMDPASLALLRLAMPMIGMTVSRMLMGFVDFAMVSQLGTAAQAAITPSAMLLFVIACAGMGLAQGVQTFVSQADGRGEPERAGPYLWQTLWIAVLVALLASPFPLLLEHWLVPIAQKCHEPEEVTRQRMQFLQYGLWSIGPMTACAGLESFYNGIRRPRIGFYAVLASLVTITIANWVLIFGHFGAPAMGIAGSGLATLLSWCVRLGVLIVPLTFREIDARYHLWRRPLPDVSKMMEVARLGGPISLQWLVDIGAWMVFLQVMLPPFGMAAEAGANLAIQYMHLSFMPALGIGMALTTQVGNAVGARAPEEALQRVRVARRLILKYMTVMGLMYVVAGRWIAGWLCFEPDPVLREAVISAAGTMLIWVAAFQFSDAICIVYSFAARGAGDTRVPALLFLACCWGIFVTGGILSVKFAAWTGYHGPWAMCTLYIVVLGALLWRRFHSQKWRAFELFKQPRDLAVAVE